MWLACLREGSSRSSEGVVSIHHVTDSRAKRSGAIVSFRESAFRGTIGLSSESIVDIVLHVPA